MEHLDKYFSGKSDNDIQEFIKDIKSLTISEKIDGTPLQMSVDDSNTGKVSFHSKSSDMKKPGPLLTSIDLFMNPAFWHQVEFLKKSVKEGKVSMYLKYIKLLNFEIVIENEHHIVQYDNKPTGNMYLLNTVSTEEGYVKHEVLKDLGKALGVEAIFSKDMKPDTLRDLISFSKSNLRGHTEEAFKAGLGHIVDKSITNTHKSIEGIVIQINGGSHDGLMLKIDSPNFVNTFDKRKHTKMTEEQEKEISEILDLALSLVDKSSLSKWSNDPLENMIMNFEKSLACDKKKLHEFASKCNSSDMSRKNALPEAIPQKYQVRLSDSDWVIGLQNFIWLFRKHRKGVLKDANGIVDIIASGSK